MLFLAPMPGARGLMRLERRPADIQTTSIPLGPATTAPQSPPSPSIGPWPPSRTSSTFALSPGGCSSRSPTMPATLAGEKQRWRGTSSHPHVQPTSDARAHRSCSHTEAIEGTLNEFKTRILGLDADDIEHIWQLIWRLGTCPMADVGAQLTRSRLLQRRPRLHECALWD